MHWAARDRYNKQWLRRVRLFARRPPKTWDPKRRVVVEIVLFCTRRYDRDNAYGSVKPILDALRHLGWVQNDSELWVDLDVSTQLVGRKRSIAKQFERTAIRIR